MRAPMSTQTPPTEPRRAAPLALWRVAQAFLITLHVVFGAPEDVAAQCTLTRKAYAQMLSWLRAGEALVRKLLLIEAAALATPAPAPPAASPVPRASGPRPSHGREERTRCEAPFDPSQPTQWRVSFRCVAGRAARQEAQRERVARPRCAAKRFIDAEPIARRFEALLRAYNDPAPYAARLARQLHAQPHRVQSILAHPPDAPNLVGREGFGQVSEAADTTVLQQKLQQRRESG